MKWACLIWGSFTAHALELGLNPPNAADDMLPVLYHDDSSKPAE
jgi:hypothetical protein